MKKFLRIFITTLIAAMTALTVGLFAACGNGGDEGGNGGNGGNGGGDNGATYTFIIVGSDDQPINGQTGGAEGGPVFSQICLSNGACAPLSLSGYSIGADGKVILTQSQINEMLEDYPDYADEDGNFTQFAFHVLGVPGYKKDCEIAVNGPKEYTLKLELPQAEVHVCESVCPLCGKCTDEDCTDAVCADKCEGHTYNLTLVLPDQTPAANAVCMVNSEVGPITANGEGKVTINLVEMLEYLDAEDEYTVTITCGEYSATVVLTTTPDDVQEFNKTVTLTAQA